ncbi:hypothetical protein E2C01_039753 [Portunus trituberculatus]|uniref:Uncharacterized protein n=1 Tax=Portunus trituberculatus TaxID=210409 RepID=A0A5B7FNV1_PORTR|nr:hypothetical protein [Portunus trituberculatus]
MHGLFIFNHPQPNKINDGQPELQHRHHLPNDSTWQNHLWGSSLSKEEHDKDSEHTRNSTLPHWHQARESLTIVAREDPREFILYGSGFVLFSGRLTAELVCRVISQISTVNS